MQAAHSRQFEEASSRTLISIQDLRAGELQRLVDDGCADCTNGNHDAKALAGKVIGLYFRKPSTRTRTSFFVAVHRLGGLAIQYGPGDLQLENGESAGDTAMIFDQCLDALVVRTDGPESELRALAGGSRRLIVINALSEEEHPTQAIADLITVQQEFGSLAGRHVLYMGAANNTAGSLLLACSQIPGMRITLGTPYEFRMPAHLVELAQKNASCTGAQVSIVHSPESLPAEVDVVYTARWQSMGKEPAVPNWRSTLNQWRVDENLMKRVGKKEAIFMHDLPASRGDEVTDAVMDGPNSRIRQQAGHKTTSAMVVLKKMLAPSEPRSTR